MQVTSTILHLVLLIKVMKGKVIVESDLQSIGIDESQRIGGWPAPEGAYPYLAGLIVSLTTGKCRLCTGSLISDIQVLTAAHCWYLVKEKEVQQGSSVEVVLGTNNVDYGGLRIITEYVVTHPYWAPPPLFFDVAIVYLPSRISFSDTVHPIKMPYDYLTESFEGVQVVSVGFGLQINNTDNNTVHENPILNHVQLTVIHNQECEYYFGSNSINDNNICTSGKGGVGICLGDSGGPLVAFIGGEPILIGVASSAGIPCQADLPSIFTRVTNVLDFIGQHMWTVYK